jgi:hypothetical protein
MIDQIKERMKKHDWFFNHSEDMASWRRGFAEEAEIIALMRKVPMKELPELMKLVPEELRRRWGISLRYPEFDGEK